MQVTQADIESELALAGLARLTLGCRLCEGPEKSFSGPMRFGELARSWIADPWSCSCCWVAAVVIGGMLLPAQHEVSRTLTLSRTPEAVWRAISDSVRIRSWRHDIIQLEHLSGFGVACGVAGDRRRRRGYDRDDSRGAAAGAAGDAPGAEAAGPSSEWTYAITRAPSGIDLTITERGRIPGLRQRFISQFTSGHAGPVERYLTELAALLRRATAHPLALDPPDFHPLDAVRIDDAQHDPFVA